MGGLAAHRRQELEGRGISLSRVTQEILYIMQVLGFDRFINICPDMETAIRAPFSNQ